MSNDAKPTEAAGRHPHAGAIAFAFALVYLSWGTTYLATRIGVHQEAMPPAIFSGSRIALAGLVILVGLKLRGHSLRIPRRELVFIILTSWLLFVAGNGLITVAQLTVESGMAATLAATTPLWMAVLESFWPRGERLLPRGWLGLLIGLVGVLLLKPPAEFTQTWGPLFALGSAVAWALGSLLLRHNRPSTSHLLTAAVQMVVGGTSLTLVGIACGELAQLPAVIPARAWGAYFYLMIAGSLVGFVAFNYLLGHVSAALVGTYAYVNPLIAVLVGWLLADEQMDARIVGGMLTILFGVALVRGATRKALPTLLEEKRTLMSGLTGYWNNPVSGREASEEPQK
jgi:drug/metabolite transporter (DMT)-like permease